MSWLPIVASAWLTRGSLGAWWTNNGVSSRTLKRQKQEFTSLGNTFTIYRSLRVLTGGPGSPGDPDLPNWGS